MNLLQTVLLAGNVNGLDCRDLMNLEFSYLLQLGDVVLRGHGVACPTHSQHLLTCQLLPVRMHRQQDGRPRQQVRGCLLPGKEEGLALLDDVPLGHTTSGRSTIDHQPQQVPRTSIITVTVVVIVVVV